MKSGWEYVDENGVHEKLAPKTLAENVLMTETGPALLDAIRDMIHPVGSVWISVENTDPNVLITGNLYCYCDNSPSVQLDSDGMDAFWITSESSVVGFGHTSLLLKSTEEDRWYYFYWGPVNKSPIAPARVFIEPIDVTIIDGVYIDLIQLNTKLAKIHDKPASYNVATFFPGTHDKSVTYAKKLKKHYDDTSENAYRFLSRNCLRVSAEVLAESYDDKESKRILDTLGAQIVPNEAVCMLRNYSNLPTSKCDVKFNDMKNMIR